MQANEFELFNIDREWYLISRQNGQLRCDTCHRGSVVFGQPLPIQRLLYDHEPQLPTTSDIGNITMVSRLSGLFVYDSTRFLLTGLDELLRSSPQSVLPDANGVLRWPAPSAINFPSTRNWFRLRTILLQESFFGYFGRFVMQRSVPQFGYQEMTLKLIRYELWRRKPIVNVEPMAKRDPPADTMKSNTESGVIIAANSQLQSFVALRLAEWVFQWPDGYLVWTAALEQSRPKRHFRIVTIVVRITYIDF